jgi:RNA polymerase sigma factor (sigma-70 family)
LDEHSKYQWVATHILPYENEVRRWLRRHIRTLRACDIDDLVQEAYTRLWLVELSHVSNGRGYFYRVIRNLLLEQARRARIVPMERLGEIESLRIPSEEPGPERRLMARQEVEQLERIVATLPEQCRRAFQLQKFAGLSQREIAQEMNISEKTVEKHLAVALLRVLDALNEDRNEASAAASIGVTRNGAAPRKD